MSGDVAEAVTETKSSVDLLQNWDSTDQPLASLESSQRNVVIELSAFSNERPFPKEV